jgi:transposase
MDSAPLPDLDGLDREALKALVLAHQAELTALEAELETQRHILSEQSQELRSSSEQIEHLKLVIEKLRRRVFGVKSEKIVVQLEQLELHLEELESSQAEMEAAVERVRPAKEPKTRSRRKPLPEHLPREVVSHTFHGDSCPDCGGKLRKFGEDVSEQLEYIPDSFKVIRHVRPKFACSGCERVVEAPAPSRPIERGLAGPGLLAHVLVSKFADHLPLYRQSEIYARQGVEIERSTLAGWVGGASELLAPLIDAIQRYVLAGTKLHADDTPLPVLSPGSGKTKTGRLWTYVRDDRPAGEDTAPSVWFAYSEDRKGEHPRQHLKNFKGGLQADANAGFHHLYGDGAIYEVACWAHARRKFHEIHVIHASPTTTEALARIGALYAIEDEVRGKPADLRLSVRQARARPLLDDLRKWMEKALRSLSAKSETAGAIRYALSRWRALTR